MRILRIHGSDGGEGGAEDYIRNISEILLREGHETMVLTFRGQPSAALDEPVPKERTFPLPPMGPTRLSHEILLDPEALRFLKKNYRDFTPDVIHLHNIINQALPSVARFLSHADTPVVMTGHDATLVCPIATLVRPGSVICEGGILPRCNFTGCRVGYGLPLMLWRRKIFERWIAPKIRAYLAPSQALARYYEANGYRPTISLPSFAEIPPELRGGPLPHRDEGIPKIGFLGRLEPTKGVDDLLLSFRRLFASGRKMVLAIAGEGHDRSRLERLSEELGLERDVHWSGRVTGEMKENWFASISCLVVPSKTFEHQTFVAMEAMVREVPVVATRIGGIPELVHDGETGLLVPIDAPSKLAEAIGRVLDDPAAAHERAVAGRRLVLAEFTPERHVERLLAAYKSIS